MFPAIKLNNYVSVIYYLKLLSLHRSGYNNDHDSFNSN